MRGPVRVEADGTRVYADGHRYKPVPAEQRKNRVLKPDHPDAVRFHGKWYLPLDVLADEARTMPMTRPDSDAYDHAAKPRRCRCQVCQRPEAEKWRAQYMRDQGLVKRPNETPRQRRRRLRIQRARRDTEIMLRRAEAQSAPAPARL